jgi:hypothetical protein
MTKKKQLETLVTDIGTTVQAICTGAKKITKKEADVFGKEMSEALIHWATPQTDRKNNLRMSNIGKPRRQLWFDLHEDTAPEEHSPDTLLRFLLGHILESLILFLAKKSGHKVEKQQEKVTCNGVSGSIDSIIDGRLVDVKTASPYSFKKFVDGRLSEDDPFGYLAQIAGYEEGLGLKDGGFLVMDKSSCKLTLHIPDDLDKPNASILIDTLRSDGEKTTPPTELCYQPIPDGKSGNMQLAKGCTWCRHKNKCFDNLRVFKYSNGYRYLTQVFKVPNVEEITHEA